jgi:LPXTG-motif cell wall-anchored protein
MTGQTKWAIYGGILAAVGIGVLILANRRRHTNHWQEP